MFSTNPFKNWPPPQAIEPTSLSVSPEAVVSIKLLLVDGSDVMRAAIRQLLMDELGIEVIGAAKSFAEAFVLADALKPDVVLMDLHMRDESKYSARLVKSQIHLQPKCVIAMSLLNDGEAKALAEDFGAHVLLDKMKLHSELIPAIKQFCLSGGIPEITGSRAERVKQPSIPSTEAA